MLDFAYKFSISNGPGILKNMQMLLLKYLLVLSFVVSISKCEMFHQIPEAPLLAPVTTNLPTHTNLPPIHKSHRKHFLAHAMFPQVPDQPPHYDSLMTSSHLSSNLSYVSKLLMKRNQDPTPSLAPAHSNEGTIPSGLVQPPLAPHISDCCGPDMIRKRGSQVCDCVYPIHLELLLMNVSFSKNWSAEFLKELASQLGLRVSQFEIANFYVVGSSGLNISMDITPHKVSFSADDVNALNSSLAWHMVRLDPTLVGDYKLLNLTWYKPPAPPPGRSSAMSPMLAPPHTSSRHRPSSAANRGEHPNLVFIISLGAGSLIVTIIVVLVICVCMSSRGKKKPPPVKEIEKLRTPVAASLDESFPRPTSMRFLGYEELKEATNNFEPASILGEGGFGRVFKGTLNDGTPVAIKKLTNGGHQGDKEFLVEVDMLSRLHHRNLVKLVGYYSNRDASQNLLCYELVPNGSLEAWLHGLLGENCPLDWDTRMKIALDAARGLAYLHEDSQPCVIHRDFKASNILLENNFNAKVSDFGLAKQAPEGQANYISTRVMGTFGYVAPEYAMTGHLLVKSDVYSYGVVLLELLSGRKPVDMSQPLGQENLVTWAWPILRDKDRLEELADLKLEGKYPKEDFVRVCTIAAACVAPEVNQRPAMGEVVQSLKMVQRNKGCQDSIPTTSNCPNLRQSSTANDSDGVSSIFSSGPFSGLSVFEHESISRAAVFSEDLHEGR